MKFFIFLATTQMVISYSSQKSHSLEQKEIKDSTTQNLGKLQELLQKNAQINTSKSKLDLENVGTDRKSKSLNFFPFFLPPILPFEPNPRLFYQQNKKIIANSFPNEWLSRTEPFKKNPPLLDSPTYYIRLPPNPYAFVPDIGYISRPPTLSHPEILENKKPDQQHMQINNDIFHEMFYRLPINFMSNGKPTSVYQLPNKHTMTKPLINLTRGPYIFNGKPNEIFLVAQIYDALYGDELTHFYP